MRMFEPLEDSELGSILVIGVETVQDSAGMVCIDALYYIILPYFDSQMEMTIRKKLDPVLTIFYSLAIAFVGVASTLKYKTTIFTNLKSSFLFNLLRLKAMIYLTTLCSIHSEVRL